MNSITKRNSSSILLALFAAVPLFFQGLFFEQHFTAFAFLFLVWACAMILFSKIHIQLDSFMDIAAIGLAFAYICTLFTGISMHTTILETVKYLVFLVFYLVSKKCFAQTESMEQVFAILKWILAATALVTLITAAGIPLAKGAYSAAENEKWLQGTVQYHNAFGILMLIGFFITAGTDNCPAKSGKFIWNSIFSFLFMFSLIKSDSRGAWVLAPVLLILFILFTAPKLRIRVFTAGIASLLSTVLFMGLFQAFVDNKQTVFALLILTAAAHVSVVLHFALRLVLDKQSEKKNFYKIAIPAVAVLIVIAILFVFVPALRNLLPDTLADRLAGINFGSETVKERGVFYKDAFNMYKDHNLVFGSGGGTWSLLYGMYQPYDYASNQTHSLLMQILVEAGALGALFFLATVTLFFVQCGIALKKKTHDNAVLSMIVCVGTALFLHSFIDFTLSYPAIMCLLWLMIGMLNSRKITNGFSVKAHKLFVSVPCILLALYVLCNFVAVLNYNNGNKVFTAYESIMQENVVTEEEQQTADLYLETAAANFKTANQLAPFNQKYAIGRVSADVAYGKEVTKERIDKIVAKDKWNTAVLREAASCLGNLGYHQEAYLQLKNAMSIEPYNLNLYPEMLPALANGLEAQIVRVGEYSDKSNTGIVKTPEGRKQAFALFKQMVDDYNQWQPMFLAIYEQLPADNKSDAAYKQSYLTQMEQAEQSVMIYDLLEVKE